MSINAITRVSTNRLVGKINGKEVGFLIDTRATHNFVDLFMAERLQLKELDVEFYEVIAARGEKMAGVRCCKGVKLNI